MSDLKKKYKELINNGKTKRECIKELISQAEKNGFKDLLKVKDLKPGDKVYIQKMNKAAAFFIAGKESLENGINILGAHVDSPRLDVKQNPLYEKDFIVYLNTHYYGGIKKYQWVTLPLAIHGVVCTKDGKTIEIKIGEEENDPVFVISDILPHLAQKQMKETASDFIPGENLDLIAGSEKPVKDSKEKEGAKKNILKLLKDKYGIEEEDFGSAELEIVPAGKARDLGFDRSLILGYGQDDRSCAFTSAQALFDSKTSEKTLCCLCVDKEEIGSVGATGMASHFFENAVAELSARTKEGFSELTVRRCLSNSNMLSSDVNAAFDPMNTDLFDKNNASFLGGGIVFNKYTGSRGKSGASDANPEYIAKIRNVLDAGSVK